MIDLMDVFLWNGCILSTLPAPEFTSLCWEGLETFVALRTYDFTGFGSQLEPFQA